MANAIGTSMFPPPRPAPPAPPKEAPPPDPDLARREALLARIVAQLERHENGLTATELRALLEEPIEKVQRALADAALARRVRRIGARRNTRYLLNG